MKLKYKLLENGAFVAGDIDTGLTSYAYPSSIYAKGARNNPAAIAEIMMIAEIPSLHASSYVAEYDASNWELLGGRQ